jgi:serine transporter
MFGSGKVMIMITSVITIPLIILLFVVPICVIPYWDLSSFLRPVSIGDFTKHILLLLPILVFAMNFSPICSSLGAFYKKECNGNTDEAVKRSDAIVKWSSILLVVFTMFFVLSLYFSMTPEVLLNAKKGNIDALTAMALVYNMPILKYGYVLIALLAIISSYFGHFVGTREGFSNIIIEIITWRNPTIKSKLNVKVIQFISTLVLFVLIWILAIYNPSILSIVGILSAPIIALYAYIMPVALMKYIPRLRIYRSKLSIVVFIIGILAIVGYYIGGTI